MKNPIMVSGKKMVDTKMTINFDAFRFCEGDNDEGQFQTFRDSIESTGSPETKSVRLADAIYNLVRENGETGDEKMEVLWRVWVIMVQVIIIVPTEHEWMDILAGALDNLSRRPGPAVPEYDEPDDTWDKLPMLGMYMRDIWAPPTLSIEVNLGPTLDRQIEEWHRLNAFCARLMSKGTIRWVDFAVWSIQEALEEPLAADSLITRSRLWDATEWIKHNADYLFEALTFYDSDPDSGSAYSTGQLFPDIKPVGTERWKFWRQRLWDLIVDCADKQVALDDVIFRRMLSAFWAIDTAQMRGRDRDIAQPIITGTDRGDSAKAKTALKDAGIGKANERKNDTDSWEKNLSKVKR